MFTAFFGDNGHHFNEGTAVNNNSCFHTKILTRFYVYSNCYVTNSVMECFMQNHVLVFSSRIHSSLSPICYVCVCVCARTCAYVNLWILTCHFFCVLASLVQPAYTYGCSLFLLHTACHCLSVRTCTWMLMWRCPVTHSAFLITHCLSSAAKSHREIHNKMNLFGKRVEELAQH